MSTRLLARERIGMTRPPSFTLSPERVASPLRFGRRSNTPSDLGQHGTQHGRVGLALASVGQRGDVTQLGAGQAQEVRLDRWPVCAGSLHGIDGSGPGLATAHAPLTPDLS